MLSTTKQLSGGKMGVVKTDISAGTLLGELRILGKVRTPVGAQGGQRFRCKCLACGKEFTVPRFYLIRKQNPKRNCGCRTYENANPYPRELRIWTMMHRRCYHSDHVAYKHYGGAGVIVCARWHRDLPDRQGFKNFVEDMGPAPTEKHTLDRINPFGNYELYGPDGKLQCRWATPKEQGNNQKRHWIERAKEEERRKKYGKVSDER